MDFVHDQLATGRKLRILTVVGTFSRFAPAIDPRLSYRGEDVVATLERVCAQIGYPKTIPVDQGTEFTSRDLDLWAYRNGLILDFSRPGKPTDNAFIEAFNGRLRAKCLNTHWFLSLADAGKSWRIGGSTTTPNDHTVCFGLPPTSAGNYRPDGPKAPHAPTIKLDHHGGLIIGHRRPTVSSVSTRGLP